MAIPDEGGRPDALEHAQLTALQVEVPRSSSSTFAQEVYEAPVKEVEVSEFRQSALDTACKIFEAEVTDLDPQPAQRVARPSTGSSRDQLAAAQCGGCIISDADSTVSDYTEQ